MTETPASEPERAPTSSDVLLTLPSGTKIKRRLLRMRACNERNAKSKLCAGHLKRWFDLTDEAKAQFGGEAELYRCERCHTIYLPNLEEVGRTGTLAW